MASLDDFTVGSLQVIEDKTECFYTDGFKYPDESWKDDCNIVVPENGIRSKIQELIGNFDKYLENNSKNNKQNLIEKVEQTISDIKESIKSTLKSEFIKESVWYFYVYNWIMNGMVKDSRLDFKKDKNGNFIFVFNKNEGKSKMDKEILKERIIIKLNNEDKVKYILMNNSDNSMLKHKEKKDIGHYYKKS